ncbi:MAG: (d)CMP kinase [Oscillospiraceae bacterium]|nr:(d)CMP kinase [Oscillospiraceae bacterium]
MMSVAIDGPSGAGKSTAARTAAAALGFAYIDTGAMYRAVGLAVRRAGKDTADPEEVAACLPGIHLALRYLSGVQHVFLGDEDVSEAIRTPEASLAASDVGRVPAVRTFLLGAQRELALRQSSVLDGRDIGTVVLPDARVKIFLTASAEERADRRCRELRAKGLDESYNNVLADIRRRDEQDANRPIAPLRPADDSIPLDSTGMSPHEVAAEIVRLVRLAAAAERPQSNEIGEVI